MADGLAVAGWSEGPAWAGAAAPTLVGRTPCRNAAAPLALVSAVMGPPPPLRVTVL